MLRNQSSTTGELKTSRCIRSFVFFRSLSLALSLSLSVCVCVCVYVKYYFCSLIVQCLLVQQLLEANPHKTIREFFEDETLDPLKLKSAFADVSQLKRALCLSFPYDFLSSCLDLSCVSYLSCVL